MHCGHYSSSLITEEVEAVIEEDMEEEDEEDLDSTDLSRNDPDKLLIDLIKDYRFMYDKIHPHYKNQQMRQNAWNKISDVLQMTEKEVENRWLRIREKYSRERKALEMEAGYESKWRLFSKLSFLNNHIKRRRRRTLRNSSVDLKSLRENTSSVDQKSSHENTSSPLRVSSPSGVDSDFDTTDQNPMTETVQTIKTTGSGSSNFRRIKADPVATQIASLRTALSGFLNWSKSSAGDQNSVDDTFAKLVSTELNSMPPDERKQKKRKIMEILYD